MSDEHPLKHRVLTGWSGCPRVNQTSFEFGLTERLDILKQAHGSILARGYGRSYGDVALNSDGCVVFTEGLKRVLLFDRDTGVVRAEAGLSLADLITMVVPEGWFPPVVPGTRWVSLGGAVANDVHGKNHPAQGSFGRHVRALSLQRSDGTVFECSSQTNEGLFRATIGGLGLTGLIQWVELQMAPLASVSMNHEILPVSDFNHLLATLRDPDPDWPYRIAWLDGWAPLPELGRGLVMRSAHAKEPGDRTVPAHFSRPPRSLPLPTLWASRGGARFFNRLYRLRQQWVGRNTKCPLWSVFFPLDGLIDLRRLYGRENGFVQFQCVVPFECAPKLPSLIETARAQGQMPQLCTVKVFGNNPSPGYLSFPTAGITLAMDLPLLNPATSACYHQLAAQVYDWGGRLYPAKDALAQRNDYWKNQPNLAAFTQWIDPGFNSDLWKRTRPPISK